MNKNLIVEIIVPTTEGSGMGVIGTGYPAAEDRILTARHVLFPPNRDTTKPIEIRWHHQPVEERQWVEISDDDVLWTGDEHWDAAVIEFPLPPKAEPWGVLSIESPRLDDWESEGFPAVGKREDNSRVATAMQGRMHRAAKVAPFFALDLNVGPEKQERLKGASGSPVMSHGKLLGVIVQCPPGFDAERLWAVPSCRLVEIPEFCKAIGYEPQTAALELLKKQVVLALSTSQESEEAMKSLEAVLSIPSDLSSKEPQAWALRLVEAMLDRALEHLVPALREVHRGLCMNRKFMAANAVADTANAILPAVFDRSAIRSLQSCMFDADMVLVDLPVATRTVAEIIMAGAEGRQACFWKAGGPDKTPMAKYRLQEPPTTGFDPDWAHWIQNTEQSLADKFVDPEDDSFIDESQRRKIIANRLEFEAEERRTRYVAFRFKADKNRTKARDALMQLKQRYPSLVLLDLSTEGSQIVQQRRLFLPFEEILKTIVGDDHRFGHSNQQITDSGMQNQPRPETIDKEPALPVTEPTETREGKPVIRYFVSYAHKDSDLKEKLLEPLQEQLAIAKDYHFEAWDDGEILAGDHWHEQIQAAVARCQFGLLLVSPAFLGSRYIQNHELRAFVARDLAAPETEKRAIPVALKRISFDGSIDLKGLEKLQVFQDRAGKAFVQRRNSHTQEEFALELFQQILKIVKRYGAHP